MSRDLPTGDQLADEQDAETRFVFHFRLALVGVFVFILGGLTVALVGWVL